MKLSVVGIGPGAPDQITPQALAVLSDAEVIVGYIKYVDMIRALFPHAEYRTTGMRGEEERCRIALSCAREGRRTAIVCSGDAGVYGLASLVLTMAAGTDVDVGIVPGLTAALTGAAVLGAPLNHDFAVISLSDLLTPWTTIEKRLRAAALGDFVIVLYNPMSRHRPEHLARACDILLETCVPERPVGIVRNIGREGQSSGITTLACLRDMQVDMFTTVFIGSSNTRVIDGRLVTPRGYDTEAKR
ncbi:MAG: precorrin-3B C(17)-methyltransferase [Clostridiales bacterium]|nr:precorrin-3B C(17)-methyltransferase [Clostridiales bacterium]